MTPGDAGVREAAAREAPADAAPGGAADARADVDADSEARGGGCGRPVSRRSAGVGAKSIGHTSYVLKIRLENGSVAAYKPRSKLPLGDQRYKGEIAAYRLGRALGLDNVPHRHARAPSTRPSSGAFGAPREPRLRPARARRRARDVRGALMPWIERYEPFPLEEGEPRARWERWLTDAATPVADDDRPMARALSTMLAFDYVTGNWDRWSGGNVARDGSTGRLLFVDNDGAFYEAPPQQSLVRQLALIRRVVRFSRSFVGALRAMDEATVREALGADIDGAPLLPDRVVADVDARRQAVVGVIDAQIARAGEAPTLAFE